MTSGKGRCRTVKRCEKGKASSPLKKCTVGGNPKFPPIVGAHGRAPVLGVAQPPPVAVPPPRACLCGARRQAAEPRFFNGLLDAHPFNLCALSRV